MARVLRLLLFGGALASILLLLMVSSAAAYIYVNRNIILYFPRDTAGTFTIENRGISPVTWNVTADEPWFSAQPTSGTIGTTAPDNTQLVVVRVDRTGLADGTYEGLLTITSTGGNDEVIIRMIVRQAPKLRVGSFLLTLSQQQSSTSFALTNEGLDPLQWTATGSEPWIVPGPPSSGTTAYDEWVSVPVHLDASALPSPDVEHFGDVIVTSNGGTATVPVRYAPVLLPGVLGLYLDGTGTNCNLSYSGPGLLTIAVVHTNTDGATAIQFAAPQPACWTDAVYLSDTDAFPITIGNSQTGKALGYGACLQAPIWATAINFFVQNISQAPCCPYPVVADPHLPSGHIEMVDCNSSLLFASGATSIVQPDGSCQCTSVVRVEETTWGRVKALYAPRKTEP